jgi:selenide,water dikinase
VTSNGLGLSALVSPGGFQLRPNPEKAADMVRPVQEIFAGRRIPYLLSGLDPSDEAAVYQVGPRKAIVQTVNLSHPMVDDPRTFGGIAAASAMSGVFALGGEVVLAMTILGYPEDLSEEVVEEIVRGGAEKVDEAGGAIAGGHLASDEQLTYGLAVTGVCDPRQYFTSAGARVGDQIYLTKPLGSGLVLEAARQGKARPEWQEEAVRWMLQLNRQAAGLAARSAHSMSQVTSLGLLGGLSEVSRRSDAGILVETRLVPAMDGAMESLATGLAAPGLEHNRQWLAGALREARPIEPPALSLLLDPQVSGGLILSVPHNRASRVETRFQDEGLMIWRIGEVTGGEPVLELM